MKARHSLLSGRMTGLAVFLFTVIPVTAQAGVQTAIVVDGQYDEWDLNKDCSTPMRSDRGCTRDFLPNVYLRYDNITNTVFVLVLQKDITQDGKIKPTVNIYSLGQNLPIDINDPEKMSHFSWVMNNGNRVGWEGAFQMTPGTYDCDENLTTSAAPKKGPGRKNASEVEVIDTDRLIKYK